MKPAIRRHLDACLPGLVLRLSVRQLYVRMTHTRFVAVVVRLRVPLPSAERMDLRRDLAALVEGRLILDIKPTVP